MIHGKQIGSPDLVSQCLLVGQIICLNIEHLRSVSTGTREGEGGGAPFPVSLADGNYRLRCFCRG